MLKDAIEKNNFTVIAGPCVLENMDKTLFLADMIMKVVNKLRKNYDFTFIFKASFDKANRTSIKSFRGPGIEEGLKIFEKIKSEHEGLFTVTDIHEATQAAAASSVVDLIQIPAFLCRQTDLLVSAAQTGRCVNIKKGQFMAPWDMEYVVEKVRKHSNNPVFVTERGTMFGYNNLVVDMTSLLYMKKNLNAKIIFDASHSVQLPSKDGISRGRSEAIPVLARAGVATGMVDGIFSEVYDDPKRAPSDAENTIAISHLEKLLVQLLEINKITMENNE